ncbi:MAG: hypothetical protein RI935_236 [Candidatus Parcubacteria bacterium]|jgi:hypothetical protein
MPFVKIYLKNKGADREKLKNLSQKYVAEAASGQVRGVVAPNEVEVVFFEKRESDHLIKDVVIQVFLKKTDERVANFEERHVKLFGDLKAEIGDFSLQTALSEHEYSES